jgi:hypothetical protein
MTTIVNNPAPESGGNGFLVGVIVLVVFVLLAVFVGLPAYRNMGTPTINVPAPQINIPNKIDVNVEQGK